jgi:hypothetical protein
VLFRSGSAEPGDEPPPEAIRFAAALDLDLAPLTFELGADIPEKAHVQGDMVRFREERPDAFVVAEELVHVAQRGLGAPGSGISHATDPAELEAVALADRLVRGEPSLTPEEAASAHTMRNTTDRFRGALRGIETQAAASTSRLHAVLGLAFYDPGRLTADGEAREAVAGYFRRVRAIAGEDRAVRRYLVNRAREIFCEAYADAQNRPVYDAISGSFLDAGTVSDLVGWLTVREGVPVPPAPASETGAASETAPASETGGADRDGVAERRPGRGEGTATGGGAGPEDASEGDGPSEADLRQLEEDCENYVREAVQALQAEFNEYFTDDSEILNILHTFRRAVRGAAQTARADVQDVLREQTGRLRTSYARRHRRSLESAIREQMVDVFSDEQAQALRLIGVRGGGGVRVRRQEGDVAAAEEARAGAGQQERDVVDQLTAALQAVAGASGDAAGEVRRVRGAYRLARAQLRSSHGESEYRESLDQLVRSRARMGLAALIASVAGDRYSLLRQLEEICEIPASERAQAPAAREGVDVDAVAGELRGRLGPFHNAIEAMKAAEGEDRRDHLGAVDRTHADLVMLARSRGLAQDRAEEALETAYHAETGHRLRRQLRLAVRGSQSLAEAMERRLGVSGLVNGTGRAAPDDSEAAADLEAAFAGLAREVQGTLQALRDAWVLHELHLGTLDGQWDQVAAEARRSGRGRRADWMPVWNRVYRRVAGLPFEGHIRQACEGRTDRLEAVNARLGLRIAATGTAAFEAEAEDMGREEALEHLDVTLEELHSTFEESFVEDEQVHRALRHCQRWARVAGMGREAWIARYADRYGSGLASPVRNRVSDPETRRACLQIIGEAEDMTAELLDRATEDGVDAAGRSALQGLAERAETFAGLIRRNRRNAALADANLLAYAHYYRGHREALRSQVPDMEAAREILERRYGALGGDLILDLYNIRDGLGRGAEAVGLGDLESWIGRRMMDLYEGRQAEGDGEDTWALAARARANSLFRRIERIPRGSRDLDLNARADSIMAAFQALVGEEGPPDEARRRRRALDLYQEVYGISLEAHIVVKTQGVGPGHRNLRALLARRTGLTLPEALVGRTDESFIREGDHLQLEEDGERFDDEAAQQAAVALRGAVQRGDLHEMTTIMQGTRGGRGRTGDERRIIRQTYDARFPAEPLRLALMRRFNGEPGLLVQALSVCGLRASMSRRDSTMAMIAERSFDGTYQEICRATEAEREEMRGDGMLMASLHRTFSGQELETLRNALRGEAGLDDLARQREGWLWNDEDGLRRDLRTRARTQWAVFRDEVRAEASRSGEALSEAELDRRIRMRMQGWAAREGADPDVVDAISETGFEDMGVEIDTLSVNDGTGELPAVERILADPSREDLLDLIDQLSEGERQRLLEDPVFMGQIRSAPRERRIEALARLRGDALMREAAAAQRGDTGGQLLAGAAMSDEEMRTWLAGRGAGAEGAVAEMQSEMQAVVDESDALAQQRARLVFRHKWAILGEARRCRGDYRDLLNKAHEAYRETDRAFDDGARQDCWEQLREPLIAILPMTGRGGDAMNLVRDLIKRVSGAESRTLHFHMEWGDNVAGVNDLLQNASDSRIAFDWSNIIQDDPQGRSFRDVVGPWSAADYPSSGPEWEAFQQFQLDASARFLDIISDGNTTTETSMIEWSNRLRRRIRGLSNGIIQAALRRRGVTVHDRYRHLLNPDDRQARTQFRENTDVLNNAMDSGWGARGFTTADDRVIVSGIRMGQAYNDTGEDGVRDAADRERIDVEQQDVDAARGQYAEAQAVVEEWATGIGAAIIGLVGTALGGPAGPTLAMALLQASAQAAFTVAVREAVRGDRYSMSREGLVDMLRGVTTEGMTIFAGRWMRSAGAVFAPEGSLIADAQGWLSSIADTNPFTRITSRVAVGTLSPPVDELPARALEGLAQQVWHGSTQNGMTDHAGNIWAEVQGTARDQLFASVLAELQRASLLAVRDEELRAYLRDGYYEESEEQADRRRMRDGLDREPERVSPDDPSDRRRVDTRPVAVIGTLVSTPADLARSSLEREVDTAESDEEWDEAPSTDVPSPGPGATAEEEAEPAR